MSEDIQKNIKKTFEESISVKKEVIEKKAYEALKLAKLKGIYSLGFLGGDGGRVLEYCSNAFIVPSEITARIQESHITAGHAMLKYIEDKLLNSGWLTKDIK